MRFDDTTWQLPIRSTHPPTPGTNNQRVYAFDDGLYTIDDAGVIRRISVDMRSPVTIFREQMTVTVGSTTVSRTVQNNQSFNVYFPRPTAALGDKYELDIVLGAGDYIFSLLAAQDTDGGEETFKLGATTIGTFNYYAAIATYNVIYRNIITVAESGLYTFSAEVTSNGAGAGYKTYPTANYFVPRIKRASYGDPP